MDRFPEDRRLNINRTYDSQKKSVNNTIIPIIQKSINKKTFPVADSVIKHIIHERHRHQREDLLKEERGAEWIEREKRRKHANARRSEVSRKSACLFLLFLINFFIT